MKIKFNWSNEDSVLILGSVCTLASIHFDWTSATFAVALGSLLKGLFSVFGIELVKVSIEDVSLILGSVVGLFMIHFEYSSPLFAIAMAAIGKGLFGLVPATPQSQTT